MDTITHFILEWAEQYFKSKDVYHRRISSIDRKKNSFIINYKEGRELILSSIHLNQLHNELSAHTSIITLNNRNNIEGLHNKWTMWKKIVSLRIYFINPFSATEQKWVINPHTHAKICDDASFRSGIKALFESVDPLTEEMLEAKLKAI